MIKVCANLICFFKGKKNLLSWAVVALAFNHSTREAEAGGSMSLRTTSSMKRVPGQPGLHRESLS
jgi:NADH:ubiquinone oxidoreductase subunit E